MNKETNYWKTAEQMNGRLAMMGFFAAVINYGLTGWIIPGIVQSYLSNQITETPRVEDGKVIAERLNGLAASIGCLALVGAYLTTGQIIPGFV